MPRYESLLLLTVLWTYGLITLVRRGQLTTVAQTITSFRNLPKVRKLALGYAAVPFCLTFMFGGIMLVLVAMNVAGRARPVPRGTSYGLTAFHEEASNNSALDSIQAVAVNGIIDSLEAVVPIDYLRSKLPPFVIRREVIPRTSETVRLLHCRLWCGCREENSSRPGYLPPGSFQLVIIQLDPMSQSYHVVADTVMRWDDYDIPLNHYTTI